MKFTLTLLVSLLCIASWAQDGFGITSYSYFVGNEEPPAEWKQINFDDSQWTTKQVDQFEYMGIGYGDNDDITLVDTTTSVYVRIPFTISTDSIDGLQLGIDFDDGFVAYINGTEVARVNLGTSGEFIAHDRLADRSHEAVIYRENIEFFLPYYYLSKDSLNKCLVDGTNVLTIQVHNDSIKGSDLSLFCWLEETSTAYYSPYGMGKITSFIDSTFLPIVVLETDEYGMYLHKTDHPAHMGIIHNEGKYNKPSDDFNIYDGFAEIETRGQSSMHWTKHSFNVETKDEEMNDTNVAILNLPREEDWVLFGPIADRSLIRNKLLFELGQKLGQYAPHSFFCELIYNGEYYGVYQFIEKIKRDTNRVNIKKLTDKNIEGVDITGGYILKYDKSDSSTGDRENSTNLVYPKKEDLLPQQVEYIENYLKDYENSFRNENLFDTEKGYKNYVDLESFVDFTILNELSKNPDSYRFSTYFYKDRDDINPRIQYGPIWDFDLAIGNSTFQEGHKTAGWQFDLPTNQRCFHTKIFKDTVAVHMFQKRWKELRKTILSNESINKKIDSLVGYLGNRVQKNYEVWPMENRILAMFSNPFTFAPTYEQEIEKLKTWINTRMDWMDNNIDDIYYKPPAVITGLERIFNTDISVYPTICNEKVNCSYTSECDITFTLTTVHGQTIQSLHKKAGTNNIAINVLDLEQGVYFINAYCDNILIYNSKIVKQ